MLVGCAPSVPPSHDGGRDPRRRPGFGRPVPTRQEIRPDPGAEAGVYESPHGVYNGIMTEQPHPIWIGCSGWSYADWEGTFYPLGMAAGEYLEFYADRFPIVEVDST